MTDSYTVTVRQTGLSFTATSLRDLIAYYEGFAASFGKAGAEMMELRLTGGRYGNAPLTLAEIRALQP